VGAGIDDVDATAMGAADTDRDAAALDNQASSPRPGQRCR
jgi:hypothetical protein